MKKSKFTEQQIAFALRQAETGTKLKPHNGHFGSPSLAGRAERSTGRIHARSIRV
jgi:hypothetical protein